jgi:hypothetical protein
MSQLPESADFARVRADKSRVLAAVADLAAHHRIRVLAAGGPVFAAQGLISPHLSRTASVIVDIASLDEFTALLFRAGWKLSPMVTRAAALPSAALALEHDAWIVDLNIYTAFPGFYADPKRVFAVLWARRRLLILFETKVMILDRLATVIMAVHDRIGPQSWSAKAQNYDRYLIDQFRMELRPKEREELYELVRSLRATEPMRPLLTALGIDGGPITLPDESYARWRLAVPSAGPATRTLLALAECPPPRRLHQSLRVLRQSPSTVARAILGSPRGLWLILTAGRRVRGKYRVLRDAAG